MKTLMFEILKNESHSGYVKCEMIFENKKPVDFLILETNKAYHEMMKNTASQVIGKTIRQLEDNADFNPEDLINNFANLLEKKKVSFIQHHQILKKTFFVKGYMLDEKTFFVTIDAYDPYKVSFEQLKKEQEIIMNSIAEGILVVSKNYEVVSVNQSALEMLGYLDGSSILGKPTFNLFLETQNRNQIERYRTEMEGIPFYNRQAKMLKADQTWLDVTYSLNRRILGDTAIGYVLSFQNISRLIELEGKLKHSEDTKSIVMSHLPGMAYRCLVNKDWTMTYVSEGAYDLTGYTNFEIEGNKNITFSEITHPEYRNDILTTWLEVIKNHGEFEKEYMIITKEGKNKWVYEKGKPVYDDKSNAVALEGIVIDLSKRRARDLEIEHMMYHDQLTGMKNRLYLDDVLLGLETENVFPIGVMLADLDSTKLINDTFGRTVGDQVISDFANILRKYETNGVITARTGGDEFTIILPLHDSQKTYDVMMAISSDIEAYSLTVKGVKLELSVSMGFETKKDNQTTIKEIIKQAENYMHRRKVIARSKTNRDALSSIKSTMIANSQETQEHMERMRDIALKVGEKLKLKQMQMDDLYLLSMLHDIGKIGIPSEIINKPGKLTDEEWVIMKTHPMIGYQIANSSNDLKSIAHGILSHHERYDGFGYPNKLKGEDIPLISRIISVVDTYDAITQDRPYRIARSHEEAIIEIQNCAGSQFDPKIVDVFISIFED